MTHHDLAKAIICLAADGGLPDTFWSTDTRIQAACNILDLSPEQARQWAETHSWDEDIEDEVED